MISHEKIEEVVRAQAQIVLDDIDVSKIGSKDDLLDFGVSSLDMVEIGGMLAKELSIKLERDDFYLADTIDDVIEVVESKLKPES